MIYLDTHVVVWLYAGDIQRFSAVARERLEQDELLISPIVQLELEYLREIERFDADSALVLESLQSSVGLSICDQSFLQVVAESVALAWTRDPFDRLIVAHAMTRNAEVMTKDRVIHQHYTRAVW